MRYTIAERAYGNPRYAYRRYRKSAASMLADARWDRKVAALKRTKRYEFLTGEPLSTTHENHCCRDKPRDRLRRARRFNQAHDRALADWFPF